MTPVELRRQGLEALINALGYVGMIRFLEQFDTGSGDYTKERHQRQDGVTVAEIMTQIKQRRNQL